tara:strand:+ start:38 stop:490 length:453 start_codon:yes stop_codon:yes gene_type:complete
MEIALKRDERIRLYLKVFIPTPEICDKIIKIKNDSENKETLEYHIDRWESIAGEHYYTRDTHFDKFSYIYNESNYVIKRDHRMYFYQITGISYQVLELIYELIRILNENSYDEDFEEFKDKKDWLKNDDILYSILSKKIMMKMKNEYLKK